MSENELQQLREDMARMRRNLAQQLAETGDIIGVIRQIDESYYEGQYFNGANDDDDDDYFGDIRRARVFLGSLSEDLRHHKDHQNRTDSTANDADTEQRITEMADELRKLNEATGSKDNEIIELKKQLAAETQKQQEHIQSLRTQTSIEEVNARELAGIELQLEDAKGQLGSVTWERDNLSEEISQIKEQLRSVQGEKEQAWAQTIALKSRLEHAQATIVELEDGNKVTQSNVNDLKSSLAEAEEQNKTLSTYEQQLRDQQEQLTDRDAQITNQLEEITSLRDEVTKQKDVISAANKVQEEQSKEIVLLERQISDASEDIARGKSRHGEIESNLSVAIGERDRLRHELALAQAKSESSLAEMKKSLDDQHKDRLDAKQSEVERLRQLVEELESHNKQLNRQVTNAENRRATQGGEEVTSQLNDLRWELDKERTKHEEATKTWRRHENELRKLLTAARHAVLQAKEEREQKESIARSLIEDLQRQLREAKS